MAASFLRLGVIGRLIFLGGARIEDGRRDALRFDLRLEAEDGSVRIGASSSASSSARASKRARYADRHARADAMGPPAQPVETCQQETPCLAMSLPSSLP
jgi:hypothetical protein